MTFKEESLFFFFFLPFKFYFQAPLAAPSLLLLEMFHLLRGRQGEGSQNSLKTEKDFAKTGRLLGGKTNSGFQCVFSLCSLLSLLPPLFCILFLSSIASLSLFPLPHSAVNVLSPSLSPPEVPLVWLVVAAVSGGDQMVTARCAAWRPGGTQLALAARHEASVMGIHPKHSSIYPSSKGSPALQLLSRKGEIPKARPPSPLTWETGRTFPECPMDSYGCADLKEVCELVVPLSPVST